MFRCFDKKHEDYIALKVVRNIQKYADSAKVEANILDDIYSLQKKRKFDGCVKMFSHFEFKGHYCMVMEPLGLSLYDLLKKRDHRGLPIGLVRSVARQLLSALEFLHSFELIHTDLKVENILFDDPELTCGSDGAPLPRSHKIKLIDFGGATYDDEHKTRIICTRQYRGPEVILGLGWSFPADVWSAGCIISEIYSGELLFPTHENTEHLALMEATTGFKFPKWMCKRASSEFKDVFDRKGRVEVERLLPSESIRFVRKTSTLQEFFRHDSNCGIIELVRALLEIDPDERVSSRRSLFYSFLRRHTSSEK